MTESVKIPGYLFKEKIGSGAMGYVFRAQQISLDRPVAIKILSPSLSGDRSYISRFLRETRAVAKLRHENIVGGIDAGEINGVYYLVMEFVDGEPLKSALKREGRISERRAFEIVLQIARALRHINEHGIVHRDVKPGNILLAKEGLAKLCDLGLAKNTTIDPTVTMTGTSMGTPHYMSPEQARGDENLDIRSDIYSLGATFYHMITGLTPFHAENPAALMAKHVGESLIPPIERNREIDPSVNDVILKMLAKRREDRYQTPADLIAALERAKREPIPAPPTDRPAGKRETAKPVRGTIHHHPTTTASRRRAAVTLTVALGLIVAIVVYLVVGGDDPVRRDRHPRNDPGGGAAATEAAHGQDMEIYRSLRSAYDERRDPAGIPRIWRNLTQNTVRYRGTPFAAFWNSELAAFETDVDAAIEPEWRPRRERAEAHLAGGRQLDALIELEQFPEKYRYFPREPRERVPSSRTRAGVEWESLRDNIVESLALRFDTDAGEIDAALKTGHHSRAWNASYDMELYITPLTPGLKERLNGLKTDIARRELQGMFDAEPTFLQFDNIRRRVEEIASANQGNPLLADLIGKIRVETDRRLQAYRADLRKKCEDIYAMFYEKYAWYLFLRDYPSARAEVAALLERKTDANLPHDVTESLFSKEIDYETVIGIMSENDGGTSSIALRTSRIDEILLNATPSNGPATWFDILLDAKAVLLLEDLMGKAKIGLGYLQKSENQEPLNLSRQPVSGRTVTGVGFGADPADGGTGAILQFASSSDRVIIPFARKRGNMCFSDEDMARFARRSYAPSLEAATSTSRNDIRLNLQCGLLFLHAGLFADAERELRTAAREDGSHAERYLKKAEPMRKQFPRAPRPTAADRLAAPPSIAGESFKTSYTFARPEEAGDWLQFAIPWNTGTVEVRDGRMICRETVGLVWRCSVRNDVTIEMDVVFLKGNELTLILLAAPGQEMKTGYATLPFAATDDEAYTHMILRQPINYSGMKMVRTTCVSAPGTKLFAIKGTETYQVKIERRGESITLFINGRKAAGGKDGSATAGLIGFRTFLTDIAIDNIRITGIFR